MFEELEEEESIKPNDGDLKILKKIEDLLGIELVPVSKIEFNMRGYFVEEGGAVEGLGFWHCSIDSEKLQSLAGMLPSLENLKHLNISGNDLTDVSRLGELTNLTKLVLAGNKLTVVSGLSKLTNLTHLNLWDNKLRDVSELGELTNLTCLDLHINKLTDISALSSLTSLTNLNLAANKLSDISALSSLTSLTRLDLRLNTIRELPEWITQWGMEIYCDSDYHEKGISLEGNPLETPPEEIVSEGREAVENYFDELKGGVDELYEAKLLIVGEERAGKSSLMEALSNPKYKFKKKLSTEGIDIKKWIIDKGEVGFAKDFRMNIWDFGGQAIYHSTHQFFLTKRSVYLLTTEARKDIRHEDFYYWLNIIKTLGGNSPVVLVVNKCDQPTIELPVNEYRETFEINDYIKVSCKDDRRGTITDLKEVLYKILRDKGLMPDIGVELPKAWVAIRHDLEDLKTKDRRDHIGYDEYLALCGKHGMDEKKALFLSDFFHDLGVFLHFSDDLSLRDTIFLNHEWVTKAVYNVLDNQEIIDNGGHFNDGDLKKIWGGKTFKDKQPQLLSLMKNRKFELCFDLPEGGYLAPQLLPGDKPDNLFDFDKPDKLNEPLMFEYQYKFMPKGILARLIVRLHKYVYEKKNWRYGVVLNHDGAKAMVRELYFDRKIRIVVEGENRREFLAVIRQHINDINRGFSNLQIDEVILCKCETCMGLIAEGKDPHCYSLEVLRTRKKRYIECPNSEEDMEVDGLLGNVIIIEKKSDDEILQILRGLRDASDSPETLLKKADKIFQFQPGAFGFGVDVKALIKMLFTKGKK